MATSNRDTALTNIKAWAEQIRGVVEDYVADKETLERLRVLTGNIISNCENAPIQDKRDQIATYERIENDVRTRAMKLREELGEIIVGL